MTFIEIPNEDRGWGLSRVIIMGWPCSWRRIWLWREKGDRFRWQRGRYQERVWWWVGDKDIDY